MAIFTYFNCLLYSENEVCVYSNEQMFLSYVKTNLAAGSLTVNYAVDDEQDASRFPALKASQCKAIGYFNH